MRVQRGDRMTASASTGITDPLIREFGQLHVLDDLIRLRAADVVQNPILAYPSSDITPASFTYYTGQDLDDMIDQTVMKLMNDGFQPPKEEGSIVALLTLSDLCMVITFFALSRLGFIVMMLSPRLSGDACASLLDMVKCETIIYGKTGPIRTIMGDILRRKLVSCRPMPNISLDNPDTSFLVVHRNRKTEVQKDKVALILHSSGSTGTPKPLFLTHRALMTHPLRGPGLTSFNPLPWYHLHGLSTALQAMWMRKTAFMWNAALPLTAEGVIAALEATQPESVAAVPYMLQLLVDNPRGISALRRCNLVTYGGAPCPDELGDRLVREGVRFGGSFGLTEAGLVAESISRPENDPNWNYLRFFDNIQQYIWMKPLGNALYECVYLAGHPALTASNSDNPLGSFHSKDVFTPHPTIPNRWKYTSRLDDRLILVNGEKVLPLPIEGYIKQDPLVHEAVVVGSGKAAPGLLIFRSQEVDDATSSDGEYLNLIWPTIQAANQHAERFSQISRDLIAVLPYASEFPRTDKGSMIRSQVYQFYHDRIQTLYSEAEKGNGALRLDLTETVSLLMNICRDELGIPLTRTDSDFFAEGIDNLKSLHLRRLILQRFRYTKGRIGLNVVYETGSVAKLAQRICALQSEGSSPITEDETEIDEVTSLIEKYSFFQAHNPVPGNSPAAKSVILTGSTGSIGAHVLYELLHDNSVSTVFCFTRREYPLEAVLRGLAAKDLYITPEQVSKITALRAILHQPSFGLGEDSSIFRHMRNSVTQIIHAAWPVNFNLPLGQFETHIQGLYNLIRFSLSVRQPEPAVLLFCSSVSTALKASSAEVSELPVKLPWAYMSYGQSKLIGEHLIGAARRTGAKAYSLRIGQVSGHSKKGLWNDEEAFPLLIRSALTLKVLPDISQTCSWLPVDKLATVILELARVASMPAQQSSETHLHKSGMEDYVDDSIYNLCNPREFNWSSLLELLRQNGFQFETVSCKEWLQRMRVSEARGEEHVNPAVKLIDHYETMYGEHSSFAQLGPRRFITEKAERDSLTLRNDRLRLVEDGILNCYIRDWVKRWMTS